MWVIRSYKWGGVGNGEWHLWGKREENLRKAFHRCFECWLHRHKRGFWSMTRTPLSKLLYEWCWLWKLLCLSQMQLLGLFQCQMIYKFLHLKGSQPHSKCTTWPFLCPLAVYWWRGRLKVWQVQALSLPKLNHNEMVDLEFPDRQLSAQNQSRVWFPIQMPYPWKVALAHLQGKWTSLSYHLYNVYILIQASRWF